MLSSASTSIFHNRRVVSWKQFWYCYERVEANSLRIHSLYQETISQEMGRQAVGSSLESLIMKEWKEDQCCEEDQKIMKRKEEQERYLLITALDSWTFHYIDWQLVSSSSFPKCEEKISSAKINVSGMIWKLERKKRTESLPCLLIHGLMIGSSGRIFLSLGQGTDPSSSPWVIMLRTDRH